MASINAKSLVQAATFIPIIPIAIVFLGYIGYGYYTFTTDETSEYTLKLKEIERTKAAIEVLKKKRKEQDQFYQSLEERKTKLRQIAQTLDKTKHLLSEEMDLPSLQKLILTEAQRAGLQVMSWQPGIETTTENYVQRSFDLEVKGLYFKLLNFLQQMANSSKIIRIEDIDLVAPNPTQKYVELNVKLKMLAYRYNASRADDIVNETSKAQFGAPAAPAPPGGVKR